jgi:hypothetical protein
MHKSGPGLLTVLLLLFGNAPSPAADVLAAQAEHVRIDLIRLPFERFSGEISGRDFFFRLPEHIVARAGSELDLVARFSPQFAPLVSGMAASVNGRELSREGMDAVVPAGTNELVLRLRVAVPAELLGAGWNRVSLLWLPRQTSAANRALLKSNSWAIWKIDSQVTVAYERLPLFPELLRFPETLAEEKLLHPGAAGSEAAPTVEILLPGQRRDVHLRAAAVLGARLGQVGYLSDRDCRMGRIENGEPPAAGRNIVLVGRADELGNVSSVTNIAGNIAALRAGQGLVAEIIEGNYPAQRRMLLVTGGDDAGVENAILTLGDAGALASAPPNPAVIDTEPKLSLATEATARPSGKFLTLKSSGWNLRSLRGYYGEESFPGWRLPPGYDLSSGVLNLLFSHSPTLTNSLLEVLVNGERVGSVGLISENASPTEAKIPLPKGLAGRDPMLLTFRASLEPAGTEGEQLTGEQAWVTISGDSSLETAAATAKIDGLNQIGRVLLRDNFLRRAAFLLPANASLEEVQMLFDLSMNLGRNLPSSPVLWPEACGYGGATPPSPLRLRGRSVLLLGSAGQWNSALPSGARLPLQLAPNESGLVRMQGRRNPIADFEPSLMFVQMAPSPWSVEETMLVAGGWRDFATPGLKLLLVEAAPAGVMFGNLCAIDANGRAASYDTRQPSAESFAERIQRRIPAGLSVADTNLRLLEEELRAQQSARFNRLMMYACGILLLLFVGVRLVLLWDRERSRRKSILEENPAPSTP